MDIKTLQVNRCCCFDVQTGSYILGWWGVISGLFSILLFSINLHSVPELVKDINSENKEKDDVKLEENHVKNMYYSIIGYNIIGFLICVLLLWGIYKNKRMFMIPWLIFHLLGILGEFFAFLLFAIISFKMGYVGIGIFALGLLFLITFLHIYFWLCVFTYYETVRLEESGVRNPNRRRNQTV